MGCDNLVRDFGMVVQVLAEGGYASDSEEVTEKLVEFRTQLKTDGFASKE